MTTAVCTSQWYCPPETLTATTRVYAARNTTYSFIQFWQLYPWLENFYAPFEKNFNPLPIFEFVSENWWVVYISLAIYMSMIIFLPMIMKKRPLKNLSTPLACWNLFLAVYSTIGAVRVVPHLLWFMSTHTFKQTVCTAPYHINGDGATGLWVTLFTLSKVAELIDSLWICLKGRRPIFLHWYHHVSVLYFTWAAHEAAHPGMYFIAMNYTVHSVMYTYYFLMAIKAKPKWLNPIYITFMQIAQMLVGVIISCFGFYYSSMDASCAVDPFVLKVSAVIYASYLYLFMQFMIKRFFVKNARAGQEGKVAASAKKNL
ncbi:hypothetical protein NSK_003634 [Nannochloropsis salina CCMP1776]|uniref:Elongation of fatty acids protein n=1 Tax=Nannochloropsis salina CCMP1776 TaxID=1027361 RepID=A0A4D9D0L7_9STRA|nr:hypothetical protein NSK_003634 [Nannochloropsis salina CCMP1776]|eukprot:TFJ85211.1 hypothetical protein NSK_003634 [Nannochloropsis salina CCMP1776]